MRTRDALTNIALSQSRLFTAKQAADIGIDRRNHSRFVKNGEWIRECRGVYRLAYLESQQDDKPDLTLLSLWSADANGEPQIVFGGEHALSIQELGDFNPKYAHISVPKTMRKSTNPPVRCIVDFEDIPGEFVHTWYTCCKIAKPLWAIASLLNQRRMSFDEQLKEAFVDALRSGLLSMKRVDDLPFDDFVKDTLKSWEKQRWEKAS